MYVDDNTKASQAYEMAGLAAQAGDKADCARWTEKAKEYGDYSLRVVLDSSTLHQLNPATQPRLAISFPSSV